MKLRVGVVLLGAVGSLVIGTTIPAAATGGHAAAKPAVASVRLSHTSLPAGGGEVRLTAKVKHASRCRIGSKPALAGLPTTVSCKHGKATTTVKIAKNRGAARSYTFTVTASSAKHKASRSIKLRQAAASPTVAPLITSASSVPATGGAITLSTSVTGATSCTFAVTPTLAGLPSTQSCSRGGVSKSVTFPATSSTTATGYHFTLTVHGAGGTVSTTLPITQLPVATGGTISGVVTDATTHTDVSGICIYVEPTGTPSGYPSTHTAADGSYTVTGLSPGSYTVTFVGDYGCGNVSAYGYQQPGPVNVTVSTQTGATANASLIANGDLQGTVSTTSGPVASICVILNLNGQPDWYYTTRSDGSYSFLGMTPGTYTLTVSNNEPGGDHPTCGASGNYAPYTYPSPITISSDVTTTANATITAD
jgi:hypothetical protein